MKSKRLVQAYLFKGPEASGKRTLARQFAQAILCDSEKSDPMEPCGECWSCKAFSHGNHPDFFEVQKDGTSIKIRTSFDIIKEALTAPYHSRGKVFLISEAENLTLEAANALLKLIEEPSDYVTFILTSSNIKGIPDTIVSRCQVIPFGAPNEKDLEEILKADFGLSEKEAHLWADYSQGSIGKAKVFLSSALGEKGKAPEMAAFKKESDVFFNEILDLSPIELALKYSRLDSDARLRAILILETRLWEECRKRVNEPWDKEEARRFYLALTHVEKAKARLKSSVNALLTFASMFLDLKRTLREGLE